MEGGYPGDPILTLGMTTGEQITLDLSALPPLCAIHRGPMREGEEMLAMTFQHARLNAPVAIAVCRSCLSEHAPAALEALEA